ncbi:MAG: hypothetical protein Q9183_007021, partial [Haloplaca sp. 2 TL-2023]
MSYPSSPRKDNPSPYRDSPSRRPRPRDVETGPYNDTPRTPTRRPRQQAHLRAESSPRTAVGDQDSLMAPQGGEVRELGRKRSLIKHERSRIDRDHPQYRYRQAARRMDVQPSTTGDDPIMEGHEDDDTYISDDPDFKYPRRMHQAGPGGMAYAESSPDRGGRRDTVPEVVGNGNKRKPQKLGREKSTKLSEEEIERKKQMDAVKPPSLWNVYCHVITFWCPGFILSCFGKPAKAQQRAWREKMGLISIILLIAAFVGFLTFGFTQAVCGQPGVRLKVNHVDNGYMIFHGRAYDLSLSSHPAAYPNILENQNVLYDLGEKFGGRDGSFMFQNVNGACKGLITLAPGSDVPTNDDEDLA